MEGCRCRCRVPQLSAHFFFGCSVEKFRVLNVRHRAVVNLVEQRRVELLASALRNGLGKNLSNAFSKVAATKRATKIIVDTNQPRL
jgi:hypothetical protein